MHLHYLAAHQYKKKTNTGEKKVSYSGVDLAYQYTPIHPTYLVYSLVEVLYPLMSADAILSRFVTTKVTNSIKI
jgi:hypothetical protein